MLNLFRQIKKSKLTKAIDISEIPALSTYSAQRLLPCHDEIEKREMSSFLKQAISELNPREQKLMRNYMLGKSLEEIAQDEEVSKERIRQIQTRAYRKIRWIMKKKMKVIEVDD